LVSGSRNGSRKREEIRTLPGPGQGKKENAESRKFLIRRRDRPFPERKNRFYSPAKAINHQDENNGVVGGFSAGKSERAEHRPKGACLPGKTPSQKKR